MMAQLSQRVIGTRVRMAREQKELSQDVLAARLGFNDRQTLSDVENGRRALRADELVRLTELLDQDVEFFTDPFSVAGEAQFSWRVAPEVPDKTLADFESQAAQWIGLLRWLRASQGAESTPLRQTLKLGPESSYEEAIARAEEMCEALRLGDAPATRLVEAVESRLDIPVLFVDTGAAPDASGISGAACHIRDFGVVLVNRRESEGRRFYDIAHELFHALTWEAMRPEHREAPQQETRRRIEQLANNFAAGLLMPAKSIRKLVDKTRSNDLAHLTSVAAALRVAPSALAWRLLNLRLIDRATVDALTQERQRPNGELLPLLSTEFARLLHHSIDRGTLSARKAAKTLGMNLSKLTEFFAEHNLPAPFQL